MIDLNILKAQYERMSDDQLINFTQNEYDKLTVDAIHLLKEEFIRRKLDVTVIESVQIEKEFSDLTKQNFIEQEISQKYLQTIWKFALEEKIKNVPDVTLYYKLLGKGLTEMVVLGIINNLSEVSKEIADDFNTKIYSGWMFFVVGFVLCMIGLNRESGILFIVYGIVVSIVGLIYLVMGYSGKNKYTRLAEKIETERTAVFNN